jgi:hypothetical protein
MSREELVINPSDRGRWCHHGPSGSVLKRYPG